jgi:hypothetical protein
MARIARTDIFAIALFFWLFGLVFLVVHTGIRGLGLAPGDNLWFIGVAAAAFAILFEWVLLTRVSVVQRTRERMSDWGLGIAQLTLIAYVAVMPIYVVIALFDRD